jgi:hypothetical protein
LVSEFLVLGFTSSRETVDGVPRCIFVDV